MPRDLATADDAAAVSADFLLALFEGGDSPASDDPVMQAVRDVMAVAFTNPPSSLTSGQREALRDLIGLMHVPAADRVAAVSTVLRAFAPADIREIAHNQAVRPLPNNGTEVETLRLYYRRRRRVGRGNLRLYPGPFADHRFPARGRRGLGDLLRQGDDAGQAGRRAARARRRDRPGISASCISSARITTGCRPRWRTSRAVDDEKLGALTAGSDGSGRNGFIDEGSDVRGHLTGYAGITRLDEILHTGGQHQLLLHVTEDSGDPPRGHAEAGVHPRAGKHRPTGGRSRSSTGLTGPTNLRAIRVRARYWPARSTTCTSGPSRSPPPSASRPGIRWRQNRYDFFPDSRTWAVFSELADTGQHAVIIRELAAGPVIPDPPAGTGSSRRVLVGDSGAYGLVSEVPEFMIPSAIARDSELVDEIHVLQTSSYSSANRRISAFLPTGVTEVAGNVFTFLAPAAIGSQTDGTGVSLYLGGTNAAHFIRDARGRLRVSRRFRGRLQVLVAGHRQQLRAARPSHDHGRDDPGRHRPRRTSSRPPTGLIPAGGTAEQVLAKASDNDFATEWIDAAMGGAGEAVASTETDDPVAFYAIMSDRTGFQADDFGDAAADIEVMEIADADIGINQGGFTVETESNVTEIVVPEAGLYSVHFHVTFERGGAADGSRTTPRSRIKRTRGSDVVYGAITTGGYLRGESTYPEDIAAVEIEQPMILMAGDKITLQVVNTTNRELDLVGADSWVYIHREEGPLAATDGFIVDVSATHHPPTATAETIRHVYKDYSTNPPKLWLGFQAYEHTTPPSVTPDAQAAAAAGYRGILYQAPAASAADDFFWSRSGHSWKYRAAGRFHNVSFTELKGEVDFFEDTDVFLNEVTSNQQAAEIIQNDGYDADVRYFYVRSDVLYRVFGDDDYDAGIGTEDLYDFIEISELVQPRNAQEDTSLTAPVTQAVWLATSIDVPHGTWAHVRFGGITDQYFRFDAEELDALTDGSNGGVSTDAQRIEFAFGDNILYLGKNASGKILLASNAPADFWPTDLTVRTN